MTTTAHPGPNPNCAARIRPHEPHTLASPGGNKPGAHCPGLLDDVDDLTGGIRGTVADAVDFAVECAEDWGLRVVARVRVPRAQLPMLTGRHVPHDGPVWEIRPAGGVPGLV